MHEMVLVTGGAGFIGSHLCETLVALGHRVRVLAHYNSQRSIGNLVHLPKNLLNEIDIIFGDIQDATCVERAIDGCSVVFHLAALIGVPYSYLAPANYINTNVLGTLNVLQACRERKVRRVIHTSTSEVYGTALKPVIDEQHPLQGQSPYSASKIAADKVAESFFRSFGTPVVTVRPFNTYGPRQSERAVLPTIIIQALKRREVRLGNASVFRDYNYVADTVEGFILASRAKNVIGETINIGSGEWRSVSDMVGLVAELLGKRLKVTQETGRYRPADSEVLKLRCDYAKARALLGYKPAHSLKEGLRSTIAFYRRNLSMFSGNEYVV